MKTFAMETQGPHISDLPVDALLEVFRLLPAADLTLGAGGVCRAWRDLTLDPAAWQGRRVQVAPRKHRPLAAAERRVLRRAPALRALAVSLRRSQDLPAPLSQLLPSCRQLRELQLSLPCLFADTAADVVRHWPRLQRLRVEACSIQEEALGQLGQLQHLRHLQVASLQPGQGVWGPLRQVVGGGLPALRTLDVDARCDANNEIEMKEAVAAVLEAADRLGHLRLGSLVPADPALLAAVGQCARLQSLHVEDCSSMTDEGLLRLAGLRLESLTLLHAKNITASALQHFLRLADLSLLRHLNLSGCLALTDRVAHLLVSRCSSPPNLVAQDCPHLSGQVLQSLRGPQSRSPAVSNISAPCTVAAASMAQTIAAPRQLAV